MIEDKDYKDVVIDNDAIVNTAPAELPAEPQNIPQGEKPELNPNPGYGEDGETKPAIKTELVEGESGTPVIENTAPKEQPEQIFNGEVVFNKEPIINGKKLTDYIDSEGGVTQEELDAGLDTKQDKLEDAESGSAVKLIGLDSEGNVVQDDIPEGIVVDETIIEDSPNAVAGGAVYDALQEVDTEIDKKANIIDLENGTLVPEKSSVAKNLEPVSSASGSTQTAPFINQGTATNNNDSQSEVDTGTLGQHLEKQGNSVVVNQLAKSVADKTENGITFTNNGDGTYTISGVATGNVSLYLNTELSIPSGSKLLVLFTENIIQGVSLNFMNSSYTGTGDLYKDGIITLSGETKYIRIIVISGTDLSTPITIMPIISNLTQWFGSNDDIPSDLLANPSHFSWFYNGDLSYNTGELVNANGRYIVNGGQNIFAGNSVDSPQYIGHYYIDNDNGYVLVANNSYNCYRLRVIPNRTYFIGRSDGSNLENIAIKRFIDNDENLISGDITGYSYKYRTFTTPSNCIYLEFAVPTSIGDIIDIDLYYEGEAYTDTSDIPVHIPYETPKVYDTGSEVLRSAGNIKDYKEPNGTIHRLVSAVDLGTLTWLYDSGSQIKYVLINDIKSPLSGNDKGNILSEKYTVVSRSSLLNVGEIALSTNKYINVKVSSESDTPSGYLYYELATSTTEQGTSFSENMDINDMGNMAWYSAYTNENTNTLVLVPQGCKIFYPAWYVGFLDTLGQREDIGWSADKIVSEDELSASETERDSQDTILLNAIGGTLRQCLCVKESLDFDDTGFVDLGELTWTYNSTWSCYTSNIIEGGKSSFKLMCSKYKYIGAYNELQDKSVAYIFNNCVAIRDTTYADATAFKNAMKGVLLAYEKASE